MSDTKKYQKFSGPATMNGGPPTAAHSPSKEDKQTASLEKEYDWDQDEQDRIQRAGWKALFSFTTKKHMPILCCAIVSTIIGGLTIPVQSILYGLLFNQFANFGSGRASGAELLSKVSEYCIYMTALGAVSWIVHGSYLMFWFAFGEMQARSARDRIFENLLAKDIIWYELRKNGIGAFLPKVQMQIRELQLATSQPMGESLLCIITSLSSLGIAFYFSWNLTLVIICTVPIVFLFMAFLSSRMTPSVHQQAEKLQEALKYVTNALQGIEVVKCFNGEGSELGKYSHAIKRAAEFYIRQANYQSLQMGFMQLVTLAMFVQGFWYGSSLIASGKKSPGQVMTTFWAALMAVQSITGFLPQLIVMEKGRVSGAKLRIVMAQMQEDMQLGSVGGVEKPEHCSGDVEFKQVSFAYPARPTELALQDVTLFFPAGETTFVVGRSGSGKSTVGQLLVRFYEPAVGQIRLDGRNLQKLDVHWLRDNITLVEQHSVLFNDTIFGNIALVRSKYGSITVDEVREVAQFALLQQMINDLPQGFNTMVGSKGNTMSGGQKQRMALARARLRNTPILILDESTSALDYVTRSLMLDAIRFWRRGKTTIIITHDIGQILPDDYVYVLDKSRVVQEGYRRTMEDNKGSPFHNFLTSEVNHIDQTDIPEDVSFPFSSLEIYHVPPGIRSDNTKRYSESIDPLDVYLDARRDSIYFPVPSPRDSVIPQLASPYWKFISESVGSLGTRHANTTSLDFPDRPISLFGNDESSILQPPNSFGHELLHSTSISKHASISTPHISNNDGDKDSLDKDSRLMKSTKLIGRRRLHAKASKQTPNSTRPLSMVQILMTVWPRLDWLSRLILMVAFFAAFVHAAATPIFAFVFSKLLSTFYIAADRDQFALLYSLTILGIAIIDGLATYALHFLLEYCAQVWANSVKVEAVGRLLNQPREFFDKDENSISRIAECLDHFAEETRNILGRFTGIIFVVFVMLCIALTWSLIICWKLTLVALAAVVILYAIITAYKAISSKWEGHSNDADELIGMVFHETFVNIKTVRSLTLERTFSAKYSQATANALRIGLKRGFYCGTFFGLNYSAIFFLTALLFYYGAKIVSSGEFATTNIISTFNLLLMSASYANSIINYVPQMGHAKDAAARFLRLSTLPQNSHESNGSMRLPTTGDIVLQNFNFAYPARKDLNVLRNVNLTIAAGSCTAIVGPSGSGKSTIASLLLKMYQAESGFTISGWEINGLHTHTLRSQVAIVSQTPVLFPGTIAENIAYGLPYSSSYASLASLRLAASAAGIDSFIDSLPSGYHTVIGEGGMGISGGQAQRIAIARALVRKPSLLILDEATSALDVESASMVRDTVHNLVRNAHQEAEVESRLESTKSEMRSAINTPITQRGMTVIIITHSREMMAIAEHIVMLDGGRVVEEGTFNELRCKRGEFARLLRSHERDDAEMTTEKEKLDVGWKGKAKDIRG